jgi:hypothetical protein
MPYGLKLRIYLFIRFTLAVVISHRWLQGLNWLVVFGSAALYALRGGSRRSVVVWKEESLDACQQRPRWA